MFLGNGQPIRPSDLTLGGCAALEVVDHILLFQTELHGCSGTAMVSASVCPHIHLLLSILKSLATALCFFLSLSLSQMTEDVLIYTFSLMYFPTPINNTSILKTNPVEVGVQCHYQR